MTCPKESYSIKSMNTEVKEHYYHISPEQYEKLYKEKEMLGSKIEDLYPYCYECGAQYDYVNKPCCPDKAISYIHPKFLHKLKLYRFGVEEFIS